MGASKKVLTSANGFVSIFNYLHAIQRSTKTSIQLLYRGCSNTTREDNYLNPRYYDTNHKQEKGECLHPHVRATTVSIQLWIEMF